MLKVLLTLLFFFSRQNKFAVLTYHRVGNINNSYNQLFTDKKFFENQLKWLSEYFTVMDLGQAIALSEQNKLPKRVVVITVDDGYVDSYQTIFPLMKKYNLVGSFFISTSGLEEGYLWDELVSSAIMQIKSTTESIAYQGVVYSLKTYNEKLICLNKILTFIKYSPLEQRGKLIDQLLLVTGKPKLDPQFLNAEQIVAMKNAGMTIGAHTENHPILALETNEIAEHEMQLSKDKLEAIIESPVDFLAYPNGKMTKDFTAIHETIAEKIGFKAALSTERGNVENVASERYALKRFSPWDYSETKFVLRLALSLILKR